jgi:hypothetical protein
MFDTRADLRAVPKVQELQRQQKAASQYSNYCKPWPTSREQPAGHATAARTATRDDGCQQRQTEARGCSGKHVPRYEDRGNPRTPHHAYPDRWKHQGTARGSGGNVRDNGGEGEVSAASFNGKDQSQAQIHEESKEEEGEGAGKGAVVDARRDANCRGNVSAEQVGDDL